MRMLVSGSNGLIGRALVASRRAAGDEVVALLRQRGQGIAPGPDGRLDPSDVADFDAVVHLAGEPVANERWTVRKKGQIWDSRVDGTQQLAAALLASGAPPRVFLCASGMNFYGDGGEAVLNETAPSGRGFLASVCVAWESAAALMAATSRVVTLRFGAVLSPEGGPLAAMLPLVRSGLAGPIAGGSQYLSWITLRDTVRAIEFVLGRAELKGPVNVVAPEPVTSRAFTAALAEAVGRPAKMPVPAWAARLMLGEIANETVLTSVRAVPRKLIDAGFRFQDPDLKPALNTFGWRGR